MLEIVVEISLEMIDLFDLPNDSNETFNKLFFLCYNVISVTVISLWQLVKNNGS